VSKLFLDANVLFTAAHNPQGKAAFLFGAPGRKRWALTSSAYAIEEARRNIAVKFPHCSAQLEALVSQLTVSAQPAPRPVPMALPEKDQPIFLAACAAAATHLITGDLRDFGPHMNKPDKTGGIIIQTVADFLDGI
jgi:uncharacterized protein